MKNKPNFFFDNRGFPNWGGGGPPLGNFSHIIPFFSWRTFLIGHLDIRCQESTKLAFAVSLRAITQLYTEASWVLGAQMAAFIMICARK